ncbi:PP2C family serine/threonine-protein phosphatase [Salinarimonas soli]|nr:PP2C family serine/threonine-protein phosphatase [Salinarimonas soli]
MSDAPLPASLWSVGGASVPGASHLRRGAPNQDAIAYAPSDGTGRVAILAVADGHGSAAHPRSASGSRIAVDAARDVLGEALADEAAPLPDPMVLGTRMVRLWRERVGAHLVRHPCHPHEVRTGDPLHLYGTTLIAAAATPRGLLLLQLGDGDLVVRFADGRVERPLPEDRGLVGDQTYSLCLPNAERRLRTAIIPDPAAIDFLMLSTDGLSKSFAHEADFLRLAGTWSLSLQTIGLGGVLAALPGWLAAASERGSGDDMTLGFLLRTAPSPGAEARKPGIRERLAGLSPRAGPLARLALAVIERLHGRRPPEPCPGPARPAPILTALTGDPR